MFKIRYASFVHSGVLVQRGFDNQLSRLRFLLRRQVDLIDWWVSPQTPRRSHLATVITTVGAIRPLLVIQLPGRYHDLILKSFKSKSPIRTLSKLLSILTSCFIGQVLCQNRITPTTQNNSKNQKVNSNRLRIGIKIDVDKSSSVKL